MNETKDFIGLSIVLFVLGGFGIYKLLKFRKGKITINIDKSTYDIDELVKGVVTVELHKTTNVNSCIISLVGEDVISYRRKGKRKEKRSEIYSDKIKVIGPKSLHPGFNENFNFSFKAPDPNNYAYFDEDRDESILEKAVDFLRQEERRVEWHISTIIDAAGIDLDSYEQIFINKNNS